MASADHWLLIIDGYIRYANQIFNLNIPIDIHKVIYKHKFQSHTGIRNPGTLNLCSLRNILSCDPTSLHHISCKNVLLTGQNNINSYRFGIECIPKLHMALESHFVISCMPLKFVFICILIRYPSM